jgi:hypothetical protein
VFASVEQVPVVTPPSADPASVAEAAPMEDAVRAAPAAEATSDAACAAAPQEAL